MKTRTLTTLHLRKSISPECFRDCLLIPLALCCFALSPAPKAFGVTPAPDGAYPGNNTAEGQSALQSLTSGLNNAAIGSRALSSDTSGGSNTATGSQTLSSNTTGFYNTANGYVALTGNTTGASNTAIGSGALHGNTTASHNTATGYISLYSNTTGSFNTATGDRALYSNTTGSQNTANGYQALDSNTSGNSNTATGDRALYSNTTGNWNTAIGNGALSFTNTAADNANTAIGYGTLGALGNFLNATGSGNIALGYGAGGALIEGDNNIYIGNQGPNNFPGEEDNTIRIGDPAVQTTTFIAGIYGVTASGGTSVYINSAGQLGTVTSSARFKREIQSMGKASEELLALRPVTFRYKKEIDPNGIPQFGLVAEEVEKVNADLVVRDAEGKPYTVRYEAVNAMLLNEFLKEHKKVEEQEATIAHLKSALTKQEATIAEQQKGFESKIAHQQTQIEALTAGLQRVSAQVEMSRPAPRTVVNNQ
jgi:Chaperone of endosialidase